MGAKKKAAAAGAAAKTAKDNRYVRQLVEDEDLRDSIRQAYESAHKAYDRMSNGKSPAKALFDDKKLQRDLRQAAESIREASTALKEGPKKSGGMFRKLMLLTVAGGLALALSESLRKKVLDALFGAEEEFEYTPTTGGGASTSSASGSTAGGSTATGGNGSGASTSAPAGSTS